MAGRPPKPTAVKVLEGTYRNDRVQSNEVLPDLLASIPGPPEGLGDWGQREWHTVCRWLHTVGNLAATDLSLIAAYCNEVDNYWSYDAHVKKSGAVVAIKNKDGLVVKVQKSPYTSLRKESLGEALKIAGQFGFTPSARSRLTMGRPMEKVKSKLDLLKERRNA